MDRVVDHLFAFEGDGVIKDFPGNYSEYREWKEREETSDKLQVTKSKETAFQVPPPPGEPARMIQSDGVRRGLSFKEKHEFEKLEQEMPSLQKEKVSLEEKMNLGTMNFDELQKAAERINEIIKLLDEKEMRWLELSERM
jgi:ATP-binding cassette subfamily F protein uup